VRDGLFRKSLLFAALLGGYPVVTPAQEAGVDAPPSVPAEAPDQEPAEAVEAADPPVDAAEPLKSPDPIPEQALGPVLRTIPTPRQVPGGNVVEVDSSVLPKDRQSIWVLDFAFKPMRMRTVELPGKGRRQIHYLWYRVVNRTGKPRMFAPQFTLVTDTGKRYEDMVIPQAIDVIRNREDPTRPLLGAVTVMGILPPSGGKEGVDDAIDGVAVWETIDPAADAFKVYVRGLSDGYQEVALPASNEGNNAADTKTITRYKTLEIDFLRPGDDRKLNEREIHLADPPYEWVYW
jgi:hypothetical protein